MHPVRRPLALLSIMALAALSLAGCLGEGSDRDETDPGTALAPYQVPARDPTLRLLETQHLVPTRDAGIELHIRLVRPDVDGPVPVVVEFTPYQALSPRNPLMEPALGAPGGTFVQQLVQRGFAFAYADLRGTGDSGGCMDLRGSVDIRDTAELADWLGTRDWSNGKVGFIGASYPGSTSHIAALSGSPYIGGVVPVVASTSFYSYHHKDGVPYQNHLTTNNAYNAIAVAPTINPQHPNYVSKYADQATCDQHHLVVQADQSGEYTAWWHDRNLRWRVQDVQVPVLMAQGLQDWNVKPDHIADYYNDVQARKILIAPQMGHSYPSEAEEAYGDWWEFVAAFFDETLRGTHTGLFDEDYAWVQANNGTWYRYEGSWPPIDALWQALHLGPQGLGLEGPVNGTVTWTATPGLDGVMPRSDSHVVFTSHPLDATKHTSGTPRLDLTVTSTAGNNHITAVLEYQAPGQNGWSRVNHGYLNPIYREGLQDPRPVLPGVPVQVSIQFYPQEDVFEEGGRLRLTLGSTDGTRTVPVFDPATITVELGAEDHPASLWLPLSPFGGQS